MIFVLGAGTYCISIVLYKKNRIQLLREYLLFYTVWTLMVLFNTFTLYIQTNLYNSDPILVITSNVLRAFGVYSLIIAIPAYIHYLCEIPGAALKNKFFSCLAVLLFTGYHIFQYAVVAKPVQKFGPYIEGAIFSGTIIYTIITGLNFYPRLQDKVRQSLAKKYIWLLIIFFPGFFCDLYFTSVIPIRIFPIFYGFLSIVFIRFFLSNYWDYSSEIQLVKKEQISPVISAQYHITEREQEIVTFVLQGLSNPEIAEKLYISLSTVKTHLRNIFSKIGVKSRYELIVYLKDYSYQQK
jgi:DNA-binding CsgD family transcriptional regulator